MGGKKRVFEGERKKKEKEEERVDKGLLFCSDHVARAYI